MRLLGVLTCMWLLGTSATLAAETTSLEAAAKLCCTQITNACIELKAAPRCIHTCHKPAIAVKPCAPAICLPNVCHKPLQTMFPCGSICLVPACHKTAVTAYPHQCESSHITLTADRNLIEERPCHEEHCCACEGCA